MIDLRKAAEMAVNVLLDPKSRADDCADAVQTLRQALAQPEQGNSSPNYPNTESNTPFVDAVNMSQERVDKTAKSKHEPVAWMSDDGFWEYEQEGIDLVPLYTAPPKREWVGLTDEELQDIAKNFSAFMTFDFARAIETKIKEKNT